MKRNTLGRMLSYLKPHQGYVAGAVLSALLGVPLALLAPVLIGQAIDFAVGAGKVDFHAIFIRLCWLAATTCAAAAAQWLLLVFTRNISVKVAKQMRKEAFHAINKAPIKSIDTHAHGDLVSRLVNDADAVAEGVMQGLAQLLPGVVTIVATMALMFMLNWLIALLVLLATPLSIVFARIVTNRTSRMFRGQTVAQGAVSSYVGEMVRRQDLVRAFGYEQDSQAEFEELNQVYFENNFKATFYSSISNPGTRFVNALVYAAVGVFGALLALSGGITIGGLSVFLSYANQYTKPFNEISAVLTQVQGAFASADRLFEVIDWQPEPADAPDAAQPVHSTGWVELEKVFFSYRDDRPLIENFNLRAQPGQRVALVGPTGCGKTTLINLLMRFYEVKKGDIRVDGTLATKIKRNSLRGLYGMVLQETWLKQGTVRDNIAYSRPDAGIEEVVAAAKAAYAHSFIKRLPQGYDTVIESGGGNLSAGQKQLLCIARIMLAKPDMLILDEATSSIDTRTEMLIQKALLKLMEGHTSFIVAHRLSTIQTADMIVVMEAGKIVETGRHEELLKRNGAYSRLYNSQFGQR